MRVVYKESITDKMYRFIHEAKLQNKEIECFVVTEEEKKEIVKSPMFIPYVYSSQFDATFMGIPIFVGNG